MKGTRICYWDSSCFLGFLNAEDDILQGCLTVLHEAEAGRLRIAVSTVAFAEVVHIKGFDRLDASKQVAISNFFDHSWLIPVDVTLGVARKAQELMWKQGSLRPYDAIHIATALQVSAVVIHSKDTNFVRVAKLCCPDGVIVGTPAVGVQESIGFVDPGQSGR